MQKKLAIKQRSHPNIVTDSVVFFLFLKEKNAVGKRSPISHDVRVLVTSISVDFDRTLMKL